MPRKRIAIIGTGIAGLGCAHFLHEAFDLAIFEQNAHAGGHSNTVTVREDGRELPVDTGFMVFNHVTYPLLTRLFRELSVETKPTDMSFAVKHEPARLEYNGHSLNTVFGNRRQLLSPRFWQFLLQISRFNRETAAALDDPRFARMTLGEYAAARGYGPDFLDLYIIPMGGAVWSTPPEKMLRFPAVSLMRFWHHHGFLGMDTRHPWWAVVDGAQSYVRKLTAPFRDRIRLNTPVARVERGLRSVTVTPHGGAPEVFDKVILAAHADQSFQMLQDATPLERELLPAFQYQSNIAILHTDEKFMPWTRRCWASWNYRVAPDGASTTHYWMNNLQGISDNVNYFVSLNADAEVCPDRVLRRIEYEHPLFDLNALDAQQRLPGLNRIAAEQTTYYCGSYFRHGFHEDAFGSAVNLCRELLGTEPW